MSRTRKRKKTDEYDDSRFVPPHNPLFNTRWQGTLADGELVLGIENLYHSDDVMPRVGLIIQANTQAQLEPPHHRVMWSDGSIEYNSEDDLAPVAHS